MSSDHDAPNPGDMLCGALAACMDSTIRMVVIHLGVTLTSLEVKVAAEVDVRGCLAVDRKVPVGFQKMECLVNFKTAEGTDPIMENMFKAASEYSCVNMNTLRSGVPITTSFAETHSKVNPSFVSVHKAAHLVCCWKPEIQKYVCAPESCFCGTL